MYFSSEGGIGNRGNDSKSSGGISSWLNVGGNCCCGCGGSNCCCCCGVGGDLNSSIGIFSLLFYGGDGGGSPGWKSSIGMLSLLFDGGGSGGPGGNSSIGTFF